MLTKQKLKAPYGFYYFLFSFRTGSLTRCDFLRKFKKLFVYLVFWLKLNRLLKCRTGFGGLSS